MNTIKEVYSDLKKQALVARTKKTLSIIEKEGLKLYRNIVSSSMSSKTAKQEAKKAFNSLRKLIARVRKRLKI